MKDKEKKVVNPDLVLAIKAMFQNNNSEMQSKMIDEVMKANFINPIIINSEISENGNNVNDGIDFNVLENNQNQKYLMAFTDWNELEKWKKNQEQQIAVLTFDDYAKMVLDEKGVTDGFVINPFGENLIFNKRLIASLFQQKQAMNNNLNETQILVGEPDVYPQEMVDAISKYMKNEININSAYLRFMVKENKPSHLIIVDCNGDLKDYVKGISESANDYLNGLQIHLFSIDSEIGKSASQNVEPFYKK